MGSVLCSPQTEILPRFCSKNGYSRHHDRAAHSATHSKYLCTCCMVDKHADFCDQRSALHSLCTVHSVMLIPLGQISLLSTIAERKDTPRLSVGLLAGSTFWIFKALSRTASWIKTYCVVTRAVLPTNFGHHAMASSAVTSLGTMPLKSIPESSPLLLMLAI